MTSTKYVVIGGAGAMGRITVKDLTQTCLAANEVVIADYDYDRAKRMAAEFMTHARYTGPHVSAIRVDANNIAETAKALTGATVVINSAQYQLNLKIMEAAYQARVHYVDLGGLFHVTRKQMEWDERFRTIGKSAIVGMGAAPGITNILSRYAADKLEKVQEIHARVASMDKTRYEPKPALAVSYSLQTILEEFSFEPAVFTKGKFTFVRPMSGADPHRFPNPIGIVRPMFTIHSEVATLPLSFQDKGVKEVSFKIAFDPEFTDKVRFLRDLGLASHEPVQLGALAVRPIELVNKIAMNQPAVKTVGKMKQYEIIRSVVKGVDTKGKKVTWIMDCHTQGMPEWGIGLDIDTGSPPAIAAQMIANGQVVRRGAIPAEVAIEPKLFFEHLKKRKMTIKATKKPGWSLKV